MPLLPDLAFIVGVASPHHSGREGREGCAMEAKVLPPLDHSDDAVASMRGIP
jgi:hypothetical protein